ncbi:hypothetical protein STA3757_26930 [Stanieria sp. NIES-3757]|nr:hypothetical protein STA3757_26930 [Stanieria sp. NIES-3757]
MNYLAFLATDEFKGFFVGIYIYKVCSMSQNQDAPELGTIYTDEAFALL